MRSRARGTRDSSKGKRFGVVELLRPIRPFAGFEIYRERAVVNPLHRIFRNPRSRRTHPSRRAIQKHWAC